MSIGFERVCDVQVNSNGTGGDGMYVQATSPTDRVLPCPVNEDNGVYTATFQPDEAGQWKISVMYEGDHIQGSPYTCFVFDPNAIKVSVLHLLRCNSPTSNQIQSQWHR